MSQPAVLLLVRLIALPRPRAPRAERERERERESRVQQTLSHLANAHPSLPFHRERLGLGIFLSIFASFSIFYCLFSVLAVLTHPVYRHFPKYARASASLSHPSIDDSFFFVLVFAGMLLLGCSAPCSGSLGPISFVCFTSALQTLMVYALAHARLSHMQPPSPPLPSLHPLAHLLALLPCNVCRSFASTAFVPILRMLLVASKQCA